MFHLQGLFVYDVYSQGLFVYHKSALQRAKVRCKRAEGTKSKETEHFLSE